MTTARPGTRALDTTGRKRISVSGSGRPMSRPATIANGPSAQIIAAASTASQHRASCASCQWPRGPNKSTSGTMPSHAAFSIRSIPNML